MKKTYRKLLFRGLKSSLTRFISIMAIVAVGTGFLSGLLATTPDMQDSVDSYYEENNLFDVYVKSGLGITEDDVNAVRELEYTEKVMPARVTDIVMQTDSGSYVTRVYGVDFSKYGTNEFLNDFVLLEGRLPADSGECLVAVPNEYTSSHKVGDVFTISRENKNFDSLSDTYAGTMTKVVGLIRLPQYMSIESEPSTVGTGKVDAVMYVPENFYSLDVYTDVYFTVAGAAELETFSDAYTELIENIENTISEFGSGRAQLRSAELTNDAQSKIDDAMEAYSSAKTESENKLGEAKAELDDGKAQLLEAKNEALEGKNQLEAAKTELALGKAQLRDAENQYSFGKAQLQSAKEEISTGWTELNSAKAQIVTAKNELATAKAELEAGEAQIRQYEPLLTVARESFNSIESALSASEEMLKKLADEGISGQTLAYWQMMNEYYRGELTKAEALISEYERQYSDGMKQIEDGKAEIAENEAKIAAGEAEIAENEKKLSDGETEIAANERKLVEAEKLISESRAKITAGEAEIASNEEKLALADSLLSENEEKIASGEKEYEEAKAEADKKLSEALTEINDAKMQIDEISDNAEWYVFGRADTVGYYTYKGNSNKIAAISKVFPVFFFAVAALVSLTTMTRMIEEERGQIGTLKAVGYTKGAIALYYVGYSVAASLLGGIFGTVIGFKLFPTVISSAYNMMYALPKMITPYRWEYAIPVIIIAILCTTAATLAACISQLREKPSSLMQQRAPAPGKRIFLERVSIIWRRLRFTYKVTARNVFRYKKRFIMTIVGVAGCSALLVTGFGLRDSINDIVAKQYGEIYKFNLTVYLNENDAAETDELLHSFLNDSEYIKNYAEIHYETGFASGNGDTESTYIYVPKYAQQLCEQFDLRVMKTGEKIQFAEDSVVITQKMSEKIGIGVGDTVVVKNAEGKIARFTVTGVAENYVQNFVFIADPLYEQEFGVEPEYKMVLADIYDEFSASRDEISEAVLKSDSILMLQFSSAVQESFTNTVKNIDYVVMVLILSAGVLAVIVLYNLTNINICERKRELATIKVLGFHRGEVASYIYRETTILSLIGTFVGFLLGIWLHKFVVNAAEVDAVMFGRTIYPASFVYAFLLTLAFMAAVDILMYRKLVKIDMVQSLKANE